MSVLLIYPAAPLRSTTLFAFAFFLFSSFPFFRNALFFFSPKKAHFTHQSHRRQKHGRHRLSFRGNPDIP
jgi:hypothetical protein